MKNAVLPGGVYIYGFETSKSSLEKGYNHFFRTHLKTTLIFSGESISIIGNILREIVSLSIQVQ